MAILDVCPYICVCVIQEGHFGAAQAGMPLRANNDVDDDDTPLIYGTSDKTCGEFAPLHAVVRTFPRHETHMCTALGRAVCQTFRW